MTITLGCSGQPGFVFEAGGPLPCREAAVARLVGRHTRNGWKRPMCVDCALAFEKHCAENELPAPEFELIPGAAELVT